MQHCYMLIAGLVGPSVCIILNVANFKGVRTGHDFGEGQLIRAAVTLNTSGGKKSTKRK
jgi:hypothetical protein